MATPPRYRHVNMGKLAVQRRQSANGDVLVHTPVPLGDYPVRLTDKLLYWAQHAPERTYIAQRDGQGDWRRISYAQAVRNVEDVIRLVLADYA